MTNSTEDHPLSVKDGKFFWRGYFKSQEDLERLAGALAVSGMRHIRQYAADIRKALQEHQ